MTELTCIGTMLHWPENDSTGSVGRSLPGLKIKLVEDEDNEINDYNINGELCFRGPTVFSGYLKDPEANASAFDEDGWFKSGDISYCDKESKPWYIADRKK
jgi:long-subunit acyl-CoA synthetase (AMP-forming)